MADEEIVEQVESPVSLLYGDPKPPEDPPTDPPSDPPEGQQTEGGGDADPPEGDDPPKGDEPGDNENDDEVELSSFSELIEHFELDPEWAENLKFTEKVNGEESEVSLAELRSSYRIGRATEDELEKAKQKSAEIIEEANRQKEEIGSTLAAFQGLLKEEYETIDRDEKAVDWKKLREDDPAEYSAKKEEFRERRARLEQRQRKAGESYQQMVSQHQEKMLGQLQEYVSKEREKLLEAIPELADKEKGPELQSKITKDLQARGFSEDEIKQTFDSRIAQMAYEAMLYRQAQNKSQAAKKKVVKIPKTLKPGSKPNGKAEPMPSKKDDPVSILYG